MEDCKVFKMGFVVFLQYVDYTVFWDGKIVVELEICCPLEQVRGETNNPYLRLLEEAMAVSIVMLESGRLNWSMVRTVQVKP